MERYVNIDRTIPRSFSLLATVPRYENAWNLMLTSIITCRNNRMDLI
jgi:hypothetical protein